VAGEAIAYSVAERDYSGVPSVVLTDEENGQQAVVLPTLGSNCVHYTIARGGESVDLLYSPPDPDALSGRASGYGIPILFPWPNRIEGGRFTFEGTEVVLDTAEPGAHVLHGFVLNRPWTVVSQGASNQEGAWVTCAFRSADFEDVGRQWPFPFEVEATYRLRDGTLALTVTGRNPGPGRLPCGMGFHPYFPLPLEDSGSRGTCTVQLPCDRTWPLREDCIPTGDVELASGAFDLREPTPLADRFYDHVWTGVTVQEGWSRCAFRDPSSGISIAVEADEAFREWVLYAPKSRPVVCFEPYTCTTNAVNLASRGIDGGLTVLEPGETLTGTMRLVPTVDGE